MYKLDINEENLSGEMNSEMEITIPLFKDICLRIGPVQTNEVGYPSSQLQKGLILISNGQELAEEGIGFGVPVLKQGVKTLFSGGMELTWLDGESVQEITATYYMNLEERLASQGHGSLKSRFLYQIKNQLADLHRRFPLLRDLLTTLSNMLRSSFGWVTTFEEVACNHAVKVDYSVDIKTRTITVAVEMIGVPMEDVTEVILMNEQGAHYFDKYSDSSGLLLHGGAIGSWETVHSETASFLSSSQQLAFTLHQIDGASLYRGRELIGDRLAWSGFGYSFPPSSRKFTYTLAIEKIA